MRDDMEVLGREWVLRAFQFQSEKFEVWMYIN